MILVWGAHYAYSMEKPSFLELLPKELKTLLMHYLTSVKDLDEAAQNIDSLSTLKIGDPDQLMQWYITSLANKFKTSKMEVAQKLEEQKATITPTVRAWLARNVQLEKELSEAAWHDNIERIKQLVKEGVDIIAQDERGMTVFGILAYSMKPANVETIRTLVNVGAKPTQSEWEAFVLAAAAGGTPAGDVEAIANLLAQFKIDPNMSYAGDSTLLARIIDQTTKMRQLPSALRIIRMLLNMGADPYIKDKNGKNAIDYARERSFPQDVIEMLMKAGKSSEEKRAPGPEKEERLRREAAIGNDAAIERLLQEGVDINAQDKKGETALIRAIKAGRLDTVKNLLAHGASKNMKFHGMTLYELALQLNHRDMANLLR